MPSARLLLPASAAVAVAYQCPVSFCGHYTMPNSFVQMRQPSEPLTFDEIDAPGNRLPAKVTDDEGDQRYEVFLRDGSWTCSRCDVSTCPTCGIMCDLSSCTGAAFEQECWCRKDRAKRTGQKLWSFRESDSKFLIQDSVEKLFCDSECKTQGGCATEGLTCQTREQACSPWWYCNLPPPEKPEKSDALFPKGMQFEENAPVFAQVSAHAQSLGRKSLKKRAKRPPNDMPQLKFTTGRWRCGRGGKPPQVQDAETLLFSDRGYIVFDAETCDGTDYGHKCYCYDRVAWLKGEDPKTSELHCDETCGMGACESRTCAREAPGEAPTAAPPKPEDLQVFEADNRADLAERSVRMEIAD